MEDGTFKAEWQGEEEQSGGGGEGRGGERERGRHNEVLWVSGGRSHSGWQAARPGPAQMAACWDALRCTFKAGSERSSKLKKKKKKNNVLPQKLSRVTERRRCRFMLMLFWGRSLKRGGLREASVKCTAAFCLRSNVVLWKPKSQQNLLLRMINPLWSPRLYVLRELLYRTPFKYRSRKLRTMIVNIDRCAGCSINTTMKHLKFLIKRSHRHSRTKTQERRINPYFNRLKTILKLHLQ